MCLVTTLRGCRYRYFGNDERILMGIREISSSCFCEEGHAQAAPDVSSQTILANFAHLSSGLRKPSNSLLRSVAVHIERQPHLMHKLQNHKAGRVLPPSWEAECKNLIYANSTGKSRMMPAASSPQPLGSLLLDKDFNSEADIGHRGRSNAALCDGGGGS